MTLFQMFKNKKTRKCYYNIKVLILTKCIHAECIYATRLTIIESYLVYNIMWDENIGVVCISLERLEAVVFVDYKIQFTKTIFNG